jgi:predicted nucleotidyltransferase
MVDIIENNIDRIIDLCKQHQVNAISVFGSAARNKLSASSDIDFLVHFSEEIEVLDYADNFFAFKEGLEEITGKEIDIISTKSLKNPVLAEEINRTKVDLYAA